MPLELSHNKSEDLGKSAKVYSPYVLYRTYEQIFNLDKITIPQDIRPLIEATYSEKDDEEWLIAYRKELEADRDKLERFARMALSNFGAPLPEERALTRYGDEPQVTVLLVKDLIEVGKDIELTFLHDEKVTLYHGVKYREIALKLELNSVQVAEYNAPAKIRDSNIIQCLRNYVYMGDEGDNYRIGVVNSAGIVGNCDKETRYSSKSGYYVKK
jgi:CRISPR-associated endonuclease/helicase Cas3